MEVELRSPRSFSDQDSRHHERRNKIDVTTSKMVFTKDLMSCCHRIENQHLQHFFNVPESTAVALPLARHLLPGRGHSSSDVVGTHGGRQTSVILSMVCLVRTTSIGIRDMGLEVTFRDSSCVGNFSPTPGRSSGRQLQLVLCNEHWTPSQSQTS